ncbi:MAG: VWA domain-containing protein [Woeseiaceae bacterium]|nr:VWA domain-containing protein [Woeseiaceae bacterium]NIP21828.1 VWA domain-containing protein [Woeseiaceae bacterium]NIS90913.1 VWA domain-containing protein [Woeseiaceae bacterium]
MLADFQFLRPEWLWGIPIVIACAILLSRRRLGPGSWQHVVDAALAPHVLARTASRRSDYRWWLLGIAGVIAILAMAGPAWQRIEQPVYRSDQALVIALDLSRSMDAQDMAPSRLMRARLKILDILERRGSGQTALVVYSSNAFTVTPLTTDTDTIAALVNSLSTDIMPSRGSYPIAAINKGRQLLEQAGAGIGEILLITDGGWSPATERVARDLRGSGFTLSVLAVGTAEGAPIPRVSGGFVTDQSGNIAVPRVEEQPLRSLAAAGGGRFSVLTTDGRDLDYLLSGETGARQAGDDNVATDLWREEGPWLVLLLLPLAAMAFRKGYVLVALLFIIAPWDNEAQALTWDDLWLTKDQQAQQLLEEGAPAEAVELFENADWRAVAQYRAGDYEGSAAAFAEQGDTRSLYNLGNAMARQGEFESAIDAYEQVLELDPEDADAAYNRDLLKQLQEQQQQSEGDQQESSDQQGEGEQSDSDNQSQEQSANSESQSDSQSEEGDASRRDDQQASEEDLEALREELRRAAEEAAQQEQQMAQQLTPEELEALRREQEQQQAMEQWLRRIPNDPGGLLRRKFRYQYQKTGKDQDGNNTWPDDEVQPW